MSTLSFTVKKFEALTVPELYAILRLRAAVFAVEQDCVYQDIDNKDQKAVHVIGYTNENQIVAYTRVFDAGDYFNEASIGRVVIAAPQRQFGHGHLLITKSIEAITTSFGIQKIKISAQSHLKKFYTKHGFVTQGAAYLEDGIPHLAMVRA